MKYSVIITYCCERKKELNELLNSINNQTISPDEIIVVTDGPAPELQDLKVTLIESKKVGRPGPMRNVGIKTAKNKYIFISDDDDIWHFQKAERQISSMLISGAAACFTKKLDFTDTIEISENKSLKSNTAYSEISFQHLLVKNPLVLSSCVIFIDSSDKKEQFFFNEKLEVRGWADYYCWLSLSRQQIKIIILNEKLLFYRVHSGSMRNGNISKMFEAQKAIILRDFKLTNLEKLLVRVLTRLRMLIWDVKSKNYFE